MKRTLLCLFFCFLAICAFSQSGIFINQVAFDTDAPKSAVVQVNAVQKAAVPFVLIDAASAKPVYSGKLTAGTAIADWFPGKVFYQADFSAFRKTGKYKLSLSINKQTFTSEEFQIGQNALAKLTIPSILSYYHNQRANTPQELNADRKIHPKGSDKQVDMRGGWADASGDISKYFSHLAYANYMSPQQIPLVAWSLASVNELIPQMLNELGVKDSIQNEAIYGADYMMRSLTAEGYFYMIIFSHFNKDPAARDIVGLLANSVTTTDYQCAFREGGGMAIAALARISQWKKDGAFTSAQYLNGAKRAFDHLLINNNKYTDDGKDNIIDDYCALMAATELWIATDLPLYQNEARKRAENLNKRITPNGYFMANDTGRPFWHAADAGLPVIALARYLTKEKDADMRAVVLNTIKKNLDYNLKVTHNTPNPFGYARQTFQHNGQLKDGFFIPHENETGWWWQGENARLGSLATAAIVGGRLVYPAAGTWGIKAPLARFAEQQLSWILGGNPYNRCFLYGFGKNNVPYMAALFGHGSEKGGISNGVTGKDGNGDGSGIDFKTEAEGNEWRWTEQWLPHAAWFLQAVAATAEPPKPRFKVLAIGENGGHHVEYTKRAKVWLNKLAADSNFTIDYYENTKPVTAEFLKQYHLFIQLDYPPYGWPKEAEKAFTEYIEQGKGGWIGFHHATLLGEFDGFPLWQWFSDFMGGIQYKNYIGDFAAGTVNIEQPKHPVMKNVPAAFPVQQEEWYIYDKSPRLNSAIQVIANVDEHTYKPDRNIKMGDHPVIWSNKKMKARNIYIFMGHGPDLFDNAAYTTIFRNAIFWGASVNK